MRNAQADRGQFKPVANQIVWLRAPARD
jgi:hypothetical protein